MDIYEIIDRGILLDGRYKVLRPLSNDGGTADVYLALDTNTIDEVCDENGDMRAEEGSGIKVAIKVYRPKNALDMGEQRFRDEFKVVFNCHHTNLVQPINFSIFEGIPYLVLPYCQNGSSELLIGQFTAPEYLWKYISDVSAGLAYLHSFNPTIVHHDIKPANVLIDDGNHYAITDFGISNKRGAGTGDEEVSGTLAYMAPERFEDGYASMAESDIWSFGATLYELITGRVPFGPEGGKKQKEGGYAPQPIKEANVPADIKKLIDDCLSIDPARRPTAEYIHACAQASQYPLKRRSWLWPVIGGVAAVGIAAAALAIFLPKPAAESEPVVPIVSNEEVYERALDQLGSDNKIVLECGLASMDSLADAGYVPALYQSGFTYGWYSDPESMRRKQVLGIECYPEGVTKNLPMDRKINNKAVSRFNRIDEISDERYPALNAEALYRMAGYYFNTDGILFNEDLPAAKDMLTRSLEWAKKADDQRLQQQASAGLEFVKKKESANASKRRPAAAPAQRDDD